METTARDPAAINSSADFWKKVLVPLTSFTILALVGWGISLSTRIALLEEREQTETKIINEFINQDKISFERTQTAVEDLKIKFIVLESTIRDHEVKRDYPETDTTKHH